MRRVGITGMGVICGSGNNVNQFWENLVHGRCGIGKIESVDTTKLRFQNGAEVRGYDRTQHFESAQQELLDRYAQFAVVAAREAVKQARPGPYT